MEVVASLSQGRTAAAQCGLFTYKSVLVIFEPPCINEFYREYLFLMFYLRFITANIGGTRWGSWLRQCATSRKIACSIPDGVRGIFH